MKKEIVSFVEQSINLPNISNGILFTEKLIEIIEKQAKNLAMRTTGNFSFDTLQSTSKKIYIDQNDFDIFRKIIKIGKIDSSDGAGPYPLSSTQNHDLPISKDSKFLTLSGTGTDQNSNFVSLNNHGIFLEISGTDIKWTVYDNSFNGVLEGSVIVEFSI